MRGNISGTLITTSPDGIVEADTISCCHCGRIWKWMTGSGRRRGWCNKCNNFTCGHERCDSCVPQEQQIENIEVGKPILHQPIKVGGFS